MRYISLLFLGIAIATGSMAMKTSKGLEQEKAKSWSRARERERVWSQWRLEQVWSQWRLEKERELVRARERERARAQNQWYDNWRFFDALLSLSAVERQEKDVIFEVLRDQPKAMSAMNTQLSQLNRQVINYIPYDIDILLADLKHAKTYNPSLIIRLVSTILDDLLLIKNKESTSSK